MTEQEFNKLRFREVSHTTFDDGYSTIYECISEPLVGRLKVCTWMKRDKKIGKLLGKKPLVHYSLDGKLYFKRERLLETIKQI